MPEFTYQDPYALGADTTEYEHVTSDFVRVERLGDHEIVVVQPEGLTFLARKAFHDIAFYLRPEHQEKVAAILADASASSGDKFVARAMLDNAVIAAEGVLPFCQDTGTATIQGKKGQFVLTGCDDAEALSRGVWETYTGNYLRYSQTAPLSLYEEKNTGNNLPAQIDLYAAPGSEYKFLFIAKGGGSGNKTTLYQKTKALLNPASLVPFLVDCMKSLGTAACPPYHIAFAIGGTSAEVNLKVVKLASAKYFDALPTSGDANGRAFRDLELEGILADEAANIGLGAQFGGRAFAHDIRVVRLPRHGASCPVGMGVSCSADRNAKAKITRDGIFLEKLEHNPARLLEGVEKAEVGDAGVKIDLNQPMDAIRAELSKHPVKTLVLLTGKLVVARDIAHAKLKERLDSGEGLPDYFKNHPVYYAGPAKKPEQMASGSFGPTTAGRMDPYVGPFQAAGGSMVMIAKGNRTKQVTDACHQYGGFYLGSIGGPAALLAKKNIRKVDVLDYPELGMEAIWEIEVLDFPAFILVDDKGNDFFAQL